MFDQALSDHPDYVRTAAALTDAFEEHTRAVDARDLSALVIASLVSEGVMPTAETLAEYRAQDAAATESDLYLCVALDAHQEVRAALGIRN